MRDSIYLQRDERNAIASKYALELSAVKCCWDKNKAREMVSSGPGEKTKHMKRLLGNVFKSVLITQRGFSETLKRRKEEKVIQIKVFIILKS